MKVSPITPVEISQQMTLALFLHAMPGGSLADDNSDDALTLDLGETLMRNPQNSFCTYAQEDCFSEQGINAGDLLLVDQKLKPQHNDIVIISLDGELLCRTLDMKESCLRAGDTEQSPILLNEHVGLAIEGVVVHAVKQFR